jgi:hypothetical protein
VGMGESRVERRLGGEVQKREIRLTGHDSNTLGIRARAKQEMGEACWRWAWGDCRARAMDGRGCGVEVVGRWWKKNGWRRVTWPSGDFECTSFCWPCHRNICIAAVPPRGLLRRTLTLNLRLTRVYDPALIMFRKDIAAENAIESSIEAVALWPRPVMDAGGRVRSRCAVSNQPLATCPYRELCLDRRYLCKSLN